MNNTTKNWKSYKKTTNIYAQPKANKAEAWFMAFYSICSGNGSGLFHSSQSQYGAKEESKWINVIANSMIKSSLYTTRCHFNNDDCAFELIMIWRQWFIYLSAITYINSHMISPWTFCELQLAGGVVWIVAVDDTLLQYVITYDEMTPFGSAGGSQLKWTPLLPTISHVSWRGADGPVISKSTDH